MINMQTTFQQRCNKTQHIILWTNQLSDKCATYIIPPSNAKLCQFKSIPDKNDLLLNYLLVIIQVYWLLGLSICNCGKDHSLDTLLLRVKPCCWAWWLESKERSSEGVHCIIRAFEPQSTPTQPMPGYYTQGCRCRERILGQLLKFCSQQRRICTKAVQQRCCQTSWRRR